MHNYTICWYLRVTQSFSLFNGPTKYGSLMAGTKRVFTLMVLGGDDNIHEGQVEPLMPKKSKGRDQPLV